MECKERKCADCTYYIQYYRKAGSGFTAIDNGRCVNRMAGGRLRKTGSVCACWQQKKEGSKERNASTLRALKLMQHKLDQIIAILQEECE